MSSMKRIIESSGGFWRDATPLLPTYIRQLNLGSYERMFRPIVPSADRSRHYFINEIAFFLAAADVAHQKLTLGDVAKTVGAKWRERIGDLALPSFDLEAVEEEEVRQIYQRLSLMLDNHCAGISGMPVTLPGVGILETVDVDVVAKDSLAEVKAGERGFRSIDVRQLLLACVVLGEASGSNWLVLINPREGICWKERASVLIEIIAMTSYSDLVSKARFYLAESGVSA